MWMSNLKISWWQNCSCMLNHGNLNDFLVTLQLHLNFEECHSEFCGMFNLVFLGMAFSTKPEAAIKKIPPSAIITSMEMIIGEYDAILSQWERAHFYNHLIWVIMLIARPLYHVLQIWYAYMWFFGRFLFFIFLVFCTSGSIFIRIIIPLTVVLLSVIMQTQCYVPHWLFYHFICAIMVIAENIHTICTKGLSIKR